MCFLKFIPQASALSDQCGDPLAPASKPSHPLSFSIAFHQLSKPTAFPNNAHMAMLNCLKMLTLNSQAISALDERLARSDALLTQTSSMVTEIPQKRETPALSVEDYHEGESTTEEGYPASDPLTSKLFGQQSYKYRLVLANAVPDTLYKDRNFGLSFKLLNLSTGELESNGNLVNVCLGVCDQNGEWVQETREGTPLLKGKLEAELYHGQGEFVKLSPRDVSRGFSGKKVSFVVYAKPSMLRYSGESSLERRVDHRLIEPLLVKDISIKAKRRD